MNIYVGNLSFDVNRNDLEKLFSEYGKLTEIKVRKLIRLLKLSTA